MKKIVQNLAVLFLGLVLGYQAGKGSEAGSGLGLLLNSLFEAKHNAFSKQNLDVASQVTKRIKQGGLILYFRHAQRQKWDSVIAFDVFETFTGSKSSEATFRDAVCLTA